MYVSFPFLGFFLLICFFQGGDQAEEGEDATEWLTVEQLEELLRKVGGDHSDPKSAAVEVDSTLHPASSLANFHYF